MTYFVLDTGQPSGAMVCAECDVASVFSSSRKSAAEQKQARVRKVATLARSGERGRALAAARNAPPVKICLKPSPTLQCGLLG